MSSGTSAEIQKVSICPATSTGHKHSSLVGDLAVSLAIVGFLVGLDNDYF